jgi:hypothetical protein
VFTFPDESAVVVPDPSSNFHHPRGAVCAWADMAAPKHVRRTRQTRVLRIAIKLSSTITPYRAAIAVQVDNADLI